MRAILQILEQLDEEEHGVKEYVRCYSCYKMQDKELADLYLNLARAELDHYAKLHAQAERLIIAKRSKYLEVMGEMYQWQHERGIAKLAELKQLIDSCK